PRRGSWMPCFKSTFLMLSLPNGLSSWTISTAVIGGSPEKRENSQIFSIASDCVQLAALSLKGYRSAMLNGRSLDFLSWLPILAEFDRVLGLPVLNGQAARDIVHALPLSARSGPLHDGAVFAGRHPADSEGPVGLDRNAKGGSLFMNDFE